MCVCILQIIELKTHARSDKQNSFSFMFLLKQREYKKERI